MKALFVSLLVIAGATAAHAGYSDNSESQDFEYLSWCENNAVTAISDKGNVYIVADCNDEKLVCKTTSKRFAGKTLVTASCKAQ